eukprot:3909190-Karenia_brevis.AAC.1
MLASAGACIQKDITKRVGYGQRAIYRKMGAKAPVEQEMYQHSDIAWAIAAHRYSGCIRGAKKDIHAMRHLSTRSSCRRGHWPSKVALKPLQRCWMTDWQPE